MKACPDAVYRYAAMKLLIELGGPDLRTPEERLEGAPDRSPTKDDDEDDDGDIVIEVGDG